jgi:hypothetical protein
MAVTLLLLLLLLLLLPPCCNNQDTGLWMLKNNKQRGTGLRLVPTAAAFQACFETTTRPGLEGITLYRWYLAQQYINDPLLINGRKFGVRLWVAVPGVAPLRVYLHRNGLALFSSTPYSPAGEPPWQQRSRVSKYSGRVCAEDGATCRAANLTSSIAACECGAQKRPGAVWLCTLQPSGSTRSPQ